MRTGPLGRREANISRFVEGDCAGFSRPSFSPVAGCELDGQRHARVLKRRKRAQNPLPQDLKYHLPINLREFLTEQFGGTLRMDEDGVFTMASSVAEHTMSQIARAIRRYSTERSREAWAERAMALASLCEALDEAAENGGRVVLCLRCAEVETGAGALEHHLGGGCVAVELSARVACYGGEQAEPQGIAEVLMHVIEGFRLARAALGLPHYDLDCYMARGQVIFTWRPLQT